MNVIVSNKQKNVLDNANIDAIKDLNGLFNVDELINNFMDYFFSKMIVDATAIVNFASEGVLRKLVNGIGAEKIILLLPPKPEPPKKFCELLVSLGLYNYSTKIEDVLRFLKTPNTLQDVENTMNNDYNNVYETTNMVENNNMDNMNNMNNMNNYPEENKSMEIGNSDEISDVNRDNKIVIGFKDVTMHAGSTTLIYMIKKELEEGFNTSCEAIEIGSSDFMFYNTKGMTSVNPNTIESFIKNSNNLN